MLTGYFQKNKVRLQKKTHEGCQNLSEEKREISITMLVNDIEIFLKKKKRKKVSMVVKDIEIFQKMKSKG